ncbi:hypothetical protein ACFVVC_07820 [Pseudarthrobacter sp. NPDC058196]|uniref:hypothetical protein n=1 Tax=Pseudarthrobacter sp. NPDC058196 TaxID=3346376 RepID=UPI0036D881A6
MKNGAKPFALVALLTATAVASAQPARADDSLILPAGLGCANFDLQLQSSGGNLQTKDFYDRDGSKVRTIAAGKGVLLTYTNLANQRSISFNTSGSVSKTTYNADGSFTVSASGHNGLILFPTDVPAGPTTTQYIGTIVYTVDPATGVFTLARTSGQAVDVCAALG